MDAVNYRAYKHWTDEEIGYLCELLRKRVSMSKISITLGRSRRAIHHAITKVIFRQCLVADPRSVAAFYGVTVEDLADIVDPKYDMPPIPRSAWSTCAVFTAVALLALNTGVILAAFATVI